MTRIRVVDDVSGILEAVRSRDLRKLEEAVIQHYVGGPAGDGAVSRAMTEMMETVARPMPVGSRPS